MAETWTTWRLFWFGGLATIWSVVINLLKLAVIVAVLHVSASRPDALVVTILVTLYLR